MIALKNGPSEFAINVGTAERVQKLLRRKRSIGELWYLPNAL